MKIKILLLVTVFWVPCLFAQVKIYDLVVIDSVKFADSYEQNYLHWPLGGCITKNGELLVVNGGENQVLLCDSAYSVKEIWGRKGRGPGEFEFQYGFMNGGYVRCFDGEIYIFDKRNNRIQVFYPNGELVRSLPFSYDIFGMTILNNKEFACSFSCPSIGGLFDIDGKKRLDIKSDDFRPIQENRRSVMQVVANKQSELLCFSENWPLIFKYNNKMEYQGFVLLKSPFKKNHMLTKIFTMNSSIYEVEQKSFFKVEGRILRSVEYVDPYYCAFYGRFIVLLDSDLNICEVYRIPLLGEDSFTLRAIKDKEKFILFCNDNVYVLGIVGATA